MSVCMDVFVCLHMLLCPFFCMWLPARVRLRVSLWSCFSVSGCVCVCTCVSSCLCFCLRSFACLRVYLCLPAPLRACDSVYLCVFLLARRSFCPCNCPCLVSVPELALSLTTSVSFLSQSLTVCLLFLVFISVPSSPRLPLFLSPSWRSLRACTSMSAKRLLAPPSGRNRGTPPIHHRAIYPSSVRSMVEKSSAKHLSILPSSTPI